MNLIVRRQERLIQKGFLIEDYFINIISFFSKQIFAFIGMFKSVLLSMCISKYAYLPIFQVSTILSTILLNDIILNKGNTMRRNVWCIPV